MPIPHHCMLIGETVLLADLLRAHLFETAGVLRAVHTDAVGHELPVILVGRSHQHLEPLLLGLTGYRADHIVRLKPRALQPRDVHGVKQLLDHRHRTAYIFGRLLALRLVERVRLVTERRPVRVKSHRNVRRVSLLEYIVKRNYEPEDSRRILPLGVDTRRTDKGVVGAINHRISVNEQQFHNTKCNV